jgi:hypothetical protein
MKRFTIGLGLFSLLLTSTLLAQQPSTNVEFGPYEYETKPEHEAFKSFHPRKAPEPGPLLFQQGDRLAICGDSITEQKMYSRLMETYLTDVKRLPDVPADRSYARLRHERFPLPPIRRHQWPVVRRSLHGHRPEI